MAVTGPNTTGFDYLVTVTTRTQAEADQVMSERINPDEDYGFDYEIGYASAPAAAKAAPVADRADRTAIRWTHADLDAIAGRTLTDDEIASIVKAIEFSTASEAITEAVEQVAGLPDDEEDEDYDLDEEEEDDEVWDGVCGHCGRTLRTDTRQDFSGSTRCDDLDPNHRHHVPEGCEP